MDLPRPATPTRMLAEDELATLESDGVLCARGLLDTASIDHLRSSLENARSGFADRRIAERATSRLPLTAFPKR